MTSHPNRSTALRRYPEPGLYEVWWCDRAGTPVRNNKPLGSHLLAGARWATAEDAQAAIDDAYDDYERRQAKKRGEPTKPVPTRCRTRMIPGTVPAPRGRLAVKKLP